LGPNKVSTVTAPHNEDIRDSPSIATTTTTNTTNITKPIGLSGLAAVASQNNPPSNASIPTNTTSPTTTSFPTTTTSLPTTTTSFPTTTSVPFSTITTPVTKTEDTFERRERPTIVHQTTITKEKPPIVHETIVTTERVEVQPVIHRDVDQTEIVRITQPFVIKEILPIERWTTEIRPESLQPVTKTYTTPVSQLGSFGLGCFGSPESREGVTQELKDAIVYETTRVELVENIPNLIHPSFGQTDLKKEAININQTGQPLGQAVHTGAPLEAPKRI